MQNLNYADFNIGYVQTHLISLISPMGHQIQWECWYFYKWRIRFTV